MDALIFDNSKWVLDPLDHFHKRGYTKEEIADLLGLIPSFIPPEDLVGSVDVIEYILNAYGFSTGPMKGGKVVAGVYKYPQDPDLYPAAMTIIDKYVMYVYEYGIVAFVNLKTGQATVYRMD